MSERQASEAADYIISIVRKQRQMNASVQCLFSTDIVQDSSQGLVPLTVGRSPHLINISKIPPQAQLETRLPDLSS